MPLATVRLNHRWLLGPNLGSLCFVRSSGAKAALRLVTGFPTIERDRELQLTSQPATG